MWFEASRGAENHLETHSLEVMLRMEVAPCALLLQQQLRDAQAARTAMAAAAMFAREPTVRCAHVPTARERSKRRPFRELCDFLAATIAPVGPALKGSALLRKESSGKHAPTAEHDACGHNILHAIAPLPPAPSKPRVPCRADHLPALALCSLLSAAHAWIIGRRMAFFASSMARCCFTAVVCTVLALNEHNFWPSSASVSLF